MENIFERVRNEVDLRLWFPFSEEARQFDRYYLDVCVAPDHPDSAPSMLVYADGVFCTACGFKADTTKAYQLYNSTLSATAAAKALLRGEFKLDPNAVVKRSIRALDPDVATRAHLRLASEPAFIERLENMGFSKRTIRQNQLGLAEVGVRTGKDEQGNEQYEQQLRFSVPVWGHNRSLKQIIYRRIDGDYSAGAKIQSESGAGVQLIGEYELEGADCVLIVEGWADRLIAYQLAGSLPYKKFACVTSTGGAGSWTKAWSELVSEAKFVYVSGDADSAGQKLVDRVLTDIPWGKPLPPLGPGGSKADLRDYYLAGGRDLPGLLKRANNEAAIRLLRRKYGNLG